jgi:hypothetical protein
MKNSPTEKKGSNPMSDETTEQIQESLEQSDKDIGMASRTFATAYIMALLTLLSGGFVASVYYGYITPNITLTATVDVGWVIEYLVMGIVALILIWSASMVLVALPGSFIAGTVGALKTIADSYQLKREE